MTTRLTKVPPARKRAVIYARISRDDTGDGMKTKRQVDKCQALCDLRGWDVVVVEEDTSISAYSGKERPAWQRVLKMIELGQVDIVVTWHLDRITRSMTELEELILLSETHGVGIATVTGDIDLTTDVGQMVARILAAVARAEVMRKARRQVLANEQRAKAGIPWTAGIKVMGYERDGVTLVPAEAEAIRQARKDALIGTPRALIARRWSEAGFESGHAASTKRSTPTKAGWTAGGVTRVLTNPRYAGLRVYGGIEVAEGAWPAIFTREEHLEIRLKLEGGANGKSKGPKPTTLLSGGARCSICGELVRGGSDRGQKTYACGTSGHVATPRDRADEYVHAMAVATLESEDILTVLAPSGDDGVDAAKAEHATLQDRLSTMAELFAAGTISGEQLAAGTAKIREALEVVEETLRSASGTSLLADLALGTDAVKDQWLQLPLARQRAILDLLFDIELVPTGKKRGSKLSTPIEEQVLVVDRA